MLLLAKRDTVHFQQETLEQNTRGDTFEFCFCCAFWVKCVGGYETATAGKSFNCKKNVSTAQPQHHAGHFTLS